MKQEMSHAASDAAHLMEERPLFLGLIDAAESMLQSDIELRRSLSDQREPRWEQLGCPAPSHSSGAWALR